MKRNKLLLSVFIVILIFFTISLLVSTLFVKNRNDVSQDQQNNYLDLTYGKTFSQRFIALHDFLNIVLIKLHNPGLVNNDQYLITLNSLSGEVLAQQTISGFNIGDPGQFRFQFTPISNSKNKQYIFSIKALTESNKETFGLKFGLAINEGSVKSFDDVRINGEVYKGVVTFTTYYRNINKFESVKDFLSRFVGNLVNDPFFSITWLIMIISLLILNIKSTRKNPLR